MKIYTKTGDAGFTSLIGGTRVSKSDLRIDAYGSVDELIAWCGLLRDSIENDKHKEVLLSIQDRLMVIASILAAGSEKFQKSLPELFEEDIKFLEIEIDRMETRLEPLHSFILPGGNPVVSWCHIARTVCRRAERKIIFISGTYPVNALVIKYINRLSDFLFVFSRLISRELDAGEIPWKPRL
jgi:cob(I)alamin adenosyltransferase